MHRNTSIIILISILRGAFEKRSKILESYNNIHLSRAGVMYSKGISEKFDKKNTYKIMAKLMILCGSIFINIFINIEKLTNDQLLTDFRHPSH